jgi:hypothetical protein
MKAALTVLEFIAEHGEEKTAYKLIDKQVSRIFGLNLSNLPDTCDLANLVEELADQLRDNPTDKEAIRAILHSIDIDFIEQLIHG